MSDINHASDVYEVPELDVATRKEKEQPAYRVYSGSRIAVGKGVGKMWKMKVDTAKRACNPMHLAWDEAYRYYNFDQTQTQTFAREVIKRGDASENVVFSNVNVLLNAVYTKNPDITCSTTDEQDVPFTKSLQSVLNQLFKRSDKLNAKSKIRRAAGFACLTDFGVLKLEFTKKEDSRELVSEQLGELSKKLAEVKDPKDAEELHGQLDALEERMLTSAPNGPRLSSLRPENVIVDPNCEDHIALTDADWIAERTFIPTQSLKAQFTQKAKEGDADVLIYKPTHKAEFAGTAGQREDALGIVMTAIDSEANVPTSHSVEERLEFLTRYFTECYYLWDKVTRRVFLFQRDDWTWPIWVWDDPYNLSRFFPYYVITYSFITGGIVGAGEVARYFDQQDEINKINAQVAKIRRTIFDFFYFNADTVDEDEVNKFVKALRGEMGGKHVLGVRAGEKKVSEMIEAFLPPAAQYEPFFNKAAAFETINRISNTNEGLRGVQFKTNTNEAAVNTYQDSLRIAIGAKVDVIEDEVAEIALSLAEMCVQFYDKEAIIGLVGKALAEGWPDTALSVSELNSTTTVNIVAGSIEKPNSVFKKKEAVQIAQAIGQFAQAAPGAAMKIMLRVLENAFTEVNIKQEDWDALDKEIAANLQRGVSTGGAEAQSNGQDVQSALQNASPEFKQKIVQMKAQGASPEQLKQEVEKYLQQVQSQQ